METNIASAQQLLRETGDEGDSTFDGASSHAKAALDEARQGLATGVAGVATAAAGAMTGGLANQSAAALQPKLDTNGAASANENGSLETAGQAERMQLVDEDQKFNSDVGKYLEKWHLADAGFAYDLCAVVGSQSTGKSTLLNKLFGTSFDVMNESQRRQTTKGIWMCRGVSMPVLVMDVEGSDGRERGEDQDFERKSALFSMASAECLLVNMWEHQVGLYQGANMGLLKTVFEVNLGLFQASKAKNHSGKDKTLIFFVIRDHIGATPLENLRATLMADLYRIWDSLSKPEGLETSRIEDFFDFDFTTLPHKLLQPQEFDKQVLQLRTRFTDRNSKGFIFKPEYHKRIPADGLPRYLETIWEQVVTNKDLDLPTQQELLAQFRCDEIASVAFGAFATEIKAFRKPIEAGSVLEALGADMGTHRSMALAKFDKEASRYHADVYKKKRVELLEKLNAALSPFFLGQLKNLHKAILASFKKSVLGRLKGDNYDFAEVVEGEKSKAELTFRAASTAICLADTDWTIDEELAQFNEDVTQIADQCRAEETKKMVTQIERTLKKEISEPVELALARPGTDMWDKVLRSFSESMEKAESSYLKKAKSFNCTEEENTVALSSLRRRAWLALRAKVDEQTADTVLMSKLRSVFEDRFRYDDEGVPRVWKPDDDIDGIFRQARDETVALVPIYAKIEPTDRNLAVSLPSTSEDPAHAAMVERGEDEEFDFPSTLNLFSETRKVEVANRFRKEADAYYVEAKRSMVSSIAQVPVWIYGVMVALGWNEFMAVVRSPLYFTFLVLCLAGAYVVWKLNMSGPILSVSKAVGREVHRLADEQLRNHFSQPLPQPAMLRETAAPSTKPAAKREEAPVEEFELKEKKPDLS